MDDRPRRTHPLTVPLGLVTEIRPLVTALLGAAVVGWRLFVGLLVANAVGQAAAWWRRTYRVAEGALGLEEGVLGRRRRQVPLERIHQVEVRQPFLHRLLGLAVVGVETAGAAGPEVELSAVTLDEATRLRALLLAGSGAPPLPVRGAPAAGVAGGLAAPPSDGPRAGAGVTGAGEGIEGPAAAEADEVTEGAAAAEAGHGAPARVLLRLRTRELLVAGITGAHVAAVPALWFWVERLAQRAPESLLAPFRPDRWGGGPVGAAAAAVALLVAWLLVATASAVVGNHGYTLARRGEDLEVTRGLLERQVATLPLRRVQAVHVVQTPLRRLFGLASVRVQSAGAGGEEARRVTVPLTRWRDAGALVGELLPDAGRPPPLLPAPRRARGRRVARGVVPTVAAALVAGVVWSPWGLVVAAAVPVGAALGLDAHRNLGHRLWRGHLAARSGVVVRQLSVVPAAKVQSVRIRSSPFQRRRRLATLTVDLAGDGRAVRVLDGDPAVLDEVAAGLLGSPAAVGEAGEPGSYSASTRSAW